MITRNAGVFTKQVIYSFADADMLAKFCRESGIRVVYRRSYKQPYTYHAVWTAADHMGTMTLYIQFDPNNLTMTKEKESFDADVAGVDNSLREMDVRLVDGAIDVEPVSRLIKEEVLDGMRLGRLRDLSAEIQDEKPGVG